MPYNQSGEIAKGLVSTLAFNLVEIGGRGGRESRDVGGGYDGLPQNPYLNEIE